MCFFEEYYGEFNDEIVYYEYDRLLCPNCDISMNSNGSRHAKPKVGRNTQKTISVRFVEKHTIQILKILSRDIPIILGLFVVKQ